MVVGQVQSAVANTDSPVIVCIIEGTSHQGNYTEKLEV